MKKKNTSQWAKNNLQVFRCSFAFFSDRICNEFRLSRLLFKAGKPVVICDWCAFVFVVELVQLQEEAPKANENGHQFDEPAPDGILLMLCSGIIWWYSVINMKFYVMFIMHINDVIVQYLNVVTQYKLCTLHYHRFQTCPIADISHGPLIIRDLFTIQFPSSDRCKIVC